MTAALAADAAERGRRVLAVDATGSGGLDEVVTGAGLAGRFETLRLTTRSSLDEYLKIYLKLPLSASKLGPLAKIFDYVAAAAPGVRELLIIGKIGWEARNGPWDEIIVDGPATGHVVELLTAPQSMAELVPTGPLSAQTGWLTEVLQASTTGLVIVTMPEELPVTETGELVDRLRAETETPLLGVIVNRTPTAIGAEGRTEVEQLVASADPLAPVAQLACARHDVAAGQLDRIADLALPTITAFDRSADPVAAVVEALVDAPWVDR